MYDLKLLAERMFLGSGIITAKEGLTFRIATAKIATNSNPNA